LLDKRVGRDKGIIFTRQLLDEFLVFVQLLQILGGKSVDSKVFSTIDVVLVTENTTYVNIGKSVMLLLDLPDVHSRTWDGRQSHGARETFIALGIVLE
jgi:hypothetical protein